MFFSLTVFLPLMHFRLDVRLNNKTGCSIPLHPAAKTVFSFLPQLTRRLEGGTNGSPKKFHFPNHYFLLLMYYCVAAGNESCAHTAVWFVSFSNKEIDPSIYKYTQTHTHTLFRRSGFSPSRRIFFSISTSLHKGWKMCKFILRSFFISMARYIVRVFFSSFLSPNITTFLLLLAVVLVGLMFVRYAAAVGGVIFTSQHKTAIRPWLILMPSCLTG